MSDLVMDTVVNSDETMRKNVFIVGGEKGGVGKTWFTWLLIELMQKEKKIPTIVDLDSTTPNVAKKYARNAYQEWAVVESNNDDIFTHEEIGKETKSASARGAKPALEKLLSQQVLLNDNPDDTEGRDRLFEIVELSDNTVISLPSQSQKGLCYWLNETDRVTSEIKSQIVLFWVSDGSYESLSLLENFMYKYPDLQYCLVVNKGIGTSSQWENYRLGKVNPDLNQMIAKKELKAIVIDKVVLSEELSIRLQKENLTFSEILADPDTNKRIAYRLKTWLEQSFKKIETTGYF
jgi:hypothetical protein